jgi:hypothetical protein
MKISELEPTNYDEIYKITDFEHFFNVVLDRRDNYVYNLNETLYMNIADDGVSYYKLTYPMQWTLISYKIYQSTRLVWFLMKLNSIGPKDVFRTLPAGSVVKYLPVETV